MCFGYYTFILLQCPGHGLTVIPDTDGPTIWCGEAKRLDASWAGPKHRRGLTTPKTNPLPSEQKNIAW